MMNQKELIRMQVMEKSGDLEQEKALIRELAEDSQPEVTRDTTILTLICC